MKSTHLFSLFFFSSFCGPFPPPFFLHTSPLSFTHPLSVVRICSEMTHPATNRPFRSEGVLVEQREGGDSEMEMNWVRAKRKGWREGSGMVFFHPAWLPWSAPTAEVWIQSAPCIQPGRIRQKMFLTARTHRHTYSIQTRHADRRPCWSVIECRRGPDKPQLLLHISACPYILARIYPELMKPPTCRCKHHSNCTSLCINNVH